MLNDVVPGAGPSAAVIVVDPFDSLPALHIDQLAARAAWTDVVNFLDMTEAQVVVQVGSIFQQIARGPCDDPRRVSIVRTSAAGTTLNSCIGSRSTRDQSDPTHHVPAPVTGLIGRAPE